MHSPFKNFLSLPLLLCLPLQGCTWKVYNWQEIPDPYFPVFSLTRVMELFCTHGANINGVTEEDQYKALTVSTALDYVRAAQAEARQLWEKEADRYSPALFARLTPRQQAVRLQEREPRQERLQRILRESEEALAFLTAHGAKTYAELSNEIENA